MLPCHRAIPEDLPQHPFHLVVFLISFCFPTALRSTQLEYLHDNPVIYDPSIMTRDFSLRWCARVHTDDCL